jgi:hypothetical protein
MLSGTSGHNRVLEEPRNCQRQGQERDLLVCLSVQLQLSILPMLRLSRAGMNHFDAHVVVGSCGSNLSVPARSIPPGAAGEEAAQEEEQQRAHQQNENIQRGVGDHARRIRSVLLSQSGNVSGSVRVVELEGGQQRPMIGLEVATRGTGLDVVMAEGELIQTSKHACVVANQEK